MFKAIFQIGYDYNAHTEEFDKINNKLEFCKKVIEKTTEYEQLSPEAKELTKKIYNFIEQNNKD